MTATSTFHLRSLTLTWVGLPLLLAGCATQDRAPAAKPTSDAAATDTPIVTTAPTESEFPTFTRRERTFPAKVGVESVTGPPRREILVRKYGDIELTEEERAILGKQEEEPEFDLMAFYEPPVPIDRGRAPWRGAAEIGANADTGGGVIERSPYLDQPVDTLPYRREFGAVYPFPTEPVDLLPIPYSAIGVYGREAADIGIGGVREPAGHHDHIDY